jgi:trk system potassium uptake protein TrkH
VLFRSSKQGGLKKQKISPAQQVVLVFLVVAAIGTILLMLPITDSPTRAITPLEAAFTTISALCVTGLTVVDTGTAWNGLGHVTILTLIQVGGLGVMLVASFIGLSLGRKMTLKQETLTGTENRTLSATDVRRLTKGIIKTALIIEGLVAIALTIRFMWGYGMGFGEALWYGIFHAISAFNNAGFSLFSDNMIGFATDPWIGAALCIAIILGGIGYPVLFQLRREFGRPLHWSMNTKLVLFMTAVLLSLGFVAFLMFEWTNTKTLASLPVLDRLQVAMFQSVQARTAGFNSVDFADVRAETLLSFDILMFIGGGPAGTAGGIKVTTFAVLLFILLTELRGEGAVNIFGKRLSRSVHREALTIGLLASAAVVGGTLILLVTSHKDLDVILFEAVSAFGTVGLSTGITADLPPVAQITLMVLMFLGRLGPLTLGTALVLRRRRILYEYPKERPAIG